MNNSFPIIKGVFLDGITFLLTVILLLLSKIEGEVNSTLFWIILVSVMIAGINLMKNVLREIRKVEEKREKNVTVKKALDQCSELLQFPICLMIYCTPETLYFIKVEKKTKQDYLNDQICNAFFKTNFNHYKRRPMGANLYDYGLAYDVSTRTERAMNALKDTFHLYTDSIDPRLKMKYQELQDNLVISSMLMCNELYSQILDNNVERFNYTHEQKQQMEFGFFDVETQKEAYTEIIDFIFRLKEYKI